MWDSGITRKEEDRLIKRVKEGLVFPKQEATPCRWCEKGKHESGFCSADHRLAWKQVTFHIRYSGLPADQIEEECKSLVRWWRGC